MTRRFPTTEEALAMHEELIDAFGGAHGVLDLGALDAAILRPQIGYYNSLIEEAAAMMESLSNNHPFVDGNKRVAFFVTDALLRLNGYFVDCDNDMAYSFFIGLYESNSFRFGNLVPWLEEHVSPLPR